MNAAWYLRNAKTFANLRFSFSVFQRFSLFTPPAFGCVTGYGSISAFDSFAALLSHRCLTASRRCRGSPARSIDSRISHALTPSGFVHLVRPNHSIQHFSFQFFSFQQGPRPGLVWPSQTSFSVRPALREAGR